MLTLLEPAGGDPRKSTIFEYDLDYAFEPDDPLTRKELHEWHTILAAIEMSDAERNHIKLELYRFGQRLIALEQHMQQAGVDDDIVAFIRPHIAMQIQQLNALGEN
ncbi:hypothetical protein [Janthinobacterium sp. HLX7-2]|uniref:hypothetical protein n=1 Tax=Janthinobacterium sp. HLX7-2 TaxID=1259331 RepID=UPI003F51C0C6